MKSLTKTYEEKGLVKLIQFPFEGENSKIQNHDVPTQITWAEWHSPWKKDKEGGQGIGRSKGGLSTKIHATCDALGNPTSFHLKAGQDHDLEGADALMEHLTQTEAVLADKAYDADVRVRRKLLEGGCEVVFYSKKNRLNPLEYDKEMHKGRHLIENFFC